MEAALSMIPAQCDELRCKLADENARLRSCLSDDAENARQIMGENAKLRELVRKWYPHMARRVGKDALEQWGQMEVVKELGITGNEPLVPEQAIAATVCERHEMHICKRCGVAYELNIIDEGFGKPRFCPNCGYREMYQ